MTGTQMRYLCKLSKAMWVSSTNIMKLHLIVGLSGQFRYHSEHHSCTFKRIKPANKCYFQWPVKIEIRCRFKQLVVDTHRHKISFCRRLWIISTDPVGLLLVNRIYVLCTMHCVFLIKLM